ncbi:MAG: IS4 family transposase [Candidatus Omnitrophota bacterium]|nr:IS4 family transposase [Candidatus Omnitrophota bacterium]
MNTGKTLFAQVMEFLPLHAFRHCVRRYQGDYKTKSFSCLDQFLCMGFAQMTYRESLRDIETCLRSMQSKLYHMGIRGTVSRNTLAHANEVRDWRIYADFAQLLIHRARTLYRDEALGVELDQPVYALDATTIDLCLSLFPWARFRRQKGAIKLHTLLDLRGPIPAFIEITDGKVHDVKILDLLVPDPGAFYVMDRGDLDFERLHHLHQAQAFFVIRAKRNLQARRLYSHPIDKTTGLQCDQTVLLTGPLTAQHYPDQLRRVRYFDAQLNKRLVFLTNQFSLPALTIAHLYKSRWQVELFFRWIKQHFRIKAFYGTSENAVKTQIWTAIATYVLIAIIRKQLGLKISLYTFLQILSVMAFEKTPLLRACLNMPEQEQTDQNPNQLLLFEL